MGITAAVAGAGALASAGASIYGANAAASAQRSAANSANALQMHMFDTTQNNLSPYIQNGGAANNRLMMMLNGGPGGLLAPFNPTMDQLQQTPGYQFTLDQGMKAVNNSNSAKGWGLSGAGQKGLADYASGLAGQTYQQQFQNYWTQNQNIFGMLSQQSQLGENAAAGQGQIAMGTGANIGGNIVGAGNATAASNIATGNAVAGAPMNMLLEYQLLNNQMNGGGNGLTNSGIYGNPF